MLRRIVIPILSFVVWLALAALSGHFLGADGLVLLLIGVGAIGALAQTYRKWWIEKSLATIDDADERPVSFVGTPKKGQLAVELAASEGWIAENLPQQHPHKISIRFTPGKGASPARDLVRALFEAGLAGKVLS